MMRYKAIHRIFLQYGQVSHYNLVRGSSWSDSLSGRTELRRHTTHRYCHRKEREGLRVE